MLSLAGLPFDVFRPQVDESRLPDEPPPDYVTRLSQSKARETAKDLDEWALVIAADTTVALGDAILGKPRDAVEAGAMLRQLRGRTHTVYSAVTLIDTASGREVTDVCASEVPMRHYTNDEIEAYVASGDPLDKAGAYAIQHRGFDPVADMQDCFASVMGLPLCHLLRSLRTLSLASETMLADLPAACQRHLDYECPVSESIVVGAPGGHHFASKL